MQFQEKKIASDVFEHWENIGRNLTHTAFEKKLNIYIERRGERKAVIWQRRVCGPVRFDSVVISVPPTFRLTLDLNRDHGKITLNVENGSTGIVETI